MLSSLGLYAHFETRFLDASEAFYRDDAQQKLQQLDVSSPPARLHFLAVFGEILTRKRSNRMCADVSCAS